MIRKRRKQLGYTQKYISEFTGVSVEYESEREEGTATMLLPLFHKDKEGSYDTLKRAWECLCRGDKDKLYSITQITIKGEDGKGRKRGKNTGTKTA